MIDRIHLEILEALYRTGSLTRAAEELHLTQPALTHSIRKLERRTGTELWKREGRNLRLTQAGEHLVRTARQLLPQLRETEAALAAYAAGKRGRLRLGVECHPCFEWLVGIIDRFLHNWPDVELDVTREFQFDGLEALLDHAVDILVTPDRVPRDKVVYHKIQDFELQLLVPDTHALAERTYVMPEDIAHETLFTYPIPLERLDVYTAFLNPAGVRPAVHKPVETIEIMVQLVAAGRGVSTFPDWLIRKYARTNPVSGVRLGERGIQKELYLACRSEDEEISFIQGFLRQGKQKHVSPD
ncbi:MAG: LysR family transcriptional regulator [Spirochaeta sp.]